MTPVRNKFFFANVRAAPYFNGGITVVSTKSGSVRRFGSRYGRTVRNKVDKIESMQRAKHMCPYCRKVKAKRISVGIWQCQSCNSKFTSKAYTVENVKKAKVVSADEMNVKEKAKSSGSKYSDKFKAEETQEENEENLDSEEDSEEDEN
jgi:large subunit ribosomal protein L37Ae